MVLMRSHCCVDFPHPEKQKQFAIELPINAFQKSLAEKSCRIPALSHEAHANVISSGHLLGDPHLSIARKGFGKEGILFPDMPHHGI